MEEQKSKNKISTYQMALVALMSAVICILAPLSIPIPISAVPISFTNLAVLFVVYILGWKMGTLSYLIYVLIGLTGLPVFSGFEGGFGKLVGPTGGYIIGFALLAVISGLFIERFPGNIFMNVVGMIIGSIVVYVFGVVWLAYQMDLTLKQAMISGMLPYLLGDGIKIVLAAIAGPIIRKNLERAGLV
ncbi:biotin transporter BioY [Anaerosacchariphilus polymeriproducens]|uniref:Biotin transporter n=1 Tax=Anaerosacchariphilus polymeriproducens TaxID=1812858 RepID=A0A371AQA1_9FIRM|nr:biotin transporter BioY [Anaerosacchariphilus polymeriproducens]RDU21759.1 biotin transporter BioY [Anaerosacchariphilus polymeriproducens]